MALDQHLRLQSGTSLVMTPQLQQAIKLLQFSHQELESFLMEQLADNPLLMLQEEKGEESGLPFEDASALGNFQELYGKGGKTTPAGQTSSLDQEGWVETLIPAAPLSLREHLLNQVNSDFLDPVKRLVGTHLVGYVHPTGYFEGELEDIAQQLGTSLAYVEGVLKALQQCDPAGVCAQTLKECLKAQLEDKQILTPPFLVLLDHLDTLAKGDLNSLRRKCQVSEPELMQMVHEIRSLSPKPGLIFEKNDASMVIPEVFMIQDEATGEWAVDLNPETMPKILLDFPYYTKIKDNLKEKEGKKYLAERLAHANWLIKALHQRATTLIRVSQEIVRKQEDFFTHGIAHLKPLVLRDVAESVELHESTISRVTNNKYIATPRGVFELKYFFNSSLEGASGINYASTTIRHRIQSLIAKEDAQKPFSDDCIVQFLKQEGIHVARRTVAKYREILRIPPAFQRKRWQATAACVS
jgi:RNA polymerase sigma-54 factor